LFELFDIYLLKDQETTFLRFRNAFLDNCRAYREVA